MTYRRYAIPYLRIIVDLKVEVSVLISYEPLFQTMKAKGISSYRLSKMGFPSSNYYAMKRGENISTHTLNNLCKLLQCRIEDIVEYIEDEE